jgi:uncharacterized protein (TIGR01777 family)
VRVLVTGASGLIGSTLCKALLARGDEAVGLSRDPEAARQKSPGVDWFAWQSTTERPPPEAFEGVDGVVNLVGEPINQRWNDDSKRRILESRTISTRNLVAAIAGLERRPKVLVSGSAIGYYGDRGDAVIDESASPGSGFAAEVSVEWEAAAQEADDLLRLVVIRTGLVLDPRDGLLKQLLTPFKLGVGGPIAGGDQYMSWVHIDDEVGVLLWALDHDEVSGTINATAPEPATNKELSKALGRALGRPAIVPVPGFALNVVLGGELAETVKGGARVIPRRAQDLGYEFRQPEIEPALRNLLA